MKEHGNGEDHSEDDPVPEDGGSQQPGGLVVVINIADGTVWVVYLGEIQCQVWYGEVWVVFLGDACI